MFICLFGCVFLKVEGEPRTRVESHGVRAGNYHSFEHGSLSATCKKTSAYAELQGKFMNHHRLQMNSFQVGLLAPPRSSFSMVESHCPLSYVIVELVQDGIKPPSQSSYRTVDNPTYLMARDEDCENLFHSTADHVRTEGGRKKWIRTTLWVPT